MATIKTRKQFRNGIDAATLAKPGLVTVTTASLKFAAKPAD